MSHAWRWQDSAACRHPKVPPVFFGAEGERQPERDARERQARDICTGCPVRLECLEYALGRPEKDGYWAGLNEDERASLRRNGQRQALKAARQPQESPAGQAEQLEEAV